MAVFIIRSHKQLPVVEAIVVNKVKASKEWDLRYQLDGVTESIAPIAMLDHKMGKATRAPGTYFAKFEDVLTQWKLVLVDAPEVDVPASPASHDQKVQRYGTIAVYGLIFCGIMLRLCMIPIWLGLVIVSGGATSVIAVIVLIDEWLSFGWLYKPRVVTGRKTLSKGK